jgi:ABC-type multidrug transport system fused ATPase/permease subunit
MKKEIVLTKKDLKAIWKIVKNEKKNAIQRLLTFLLSVLSIVWLIALVINLIYNFAIAPNVGKNSGITFTPELVAIFIGFTVLALLEVIYWFITSNGARKAFYEETPEKFKVDTEHKFISFQDDVSSYSEKIEKNFEAISREWVKYSSKHFTFYLKALDADELKRGNA